MTLRVFDPDSLAVASHREIWLAAKPTVRRAIADRWAKGVPANEMLVVIADSGGGVGGRIIQTFFGEHVVEPETGDDDAPVVAVVVGVQRHELFEPDDDASKFFHALAPSEVGLMILGPEGPALAAIEVRVRRARMH